MKGKSKPLPVERPLSRERISIVAEYVYGERHRISDEELEQAISVVRDAFKGKNPKMSD